VLCGYDSSNRDILVADPYQPNLAKERYYEVGVNRLICSILLGVLTYDSNLLVVTPKRDRS
jgi:hypothetical protein